MSFISAIIPILFLFFSSNAILFLIVRIGFRRKIEDFLLVVFSYGVGPFIFSLIFYALLFILPGKSNYFYASFIALACLFIFSLCLRVRQEIKDIYLKVFYKSLILIKKQSRIILVIAGFFIGLYSLQLIAFPIVDNDSVLYLNQTEAFYEYKNLGWQKESKVIINEDQSYKCNSSIRPGIPILLSATYLFQGDGRYELTSLRSVVLYYYLLLLILFLFSIKKLSGKLSLNSKHNLSYGLLLFVFSWGLTRGLIFSAKEPVIYFFALFSILITTHLLKGEYANWQNRFFLSILLGINAFVNLHGIIIECIILLLLFLFLKKNIVRRIFEIILVFLLSLPFGGFEFVMFYGFIFSETVNSIVQQLGIFSDNSSNTINNGAKLNSDTVNLTAHRNLYQTGNVQSDYLKGKLQILTNIGYFGFIFWLYLFIVIKFKQIIKNDFLKIITAFIFIYYIVVIDPLGFNKHPLSIVLWGSPKYAMLLIFLSMIPVAAYLDTISVQVIYFFEKNIRKLLAVGVILMIVMMTLYSNIINLGTKMLLLTIPVFKDVSFYEEKVKEFYFILLALLVFLIISFILSIININKKAVYYSAHLVFVLMVLGPFFVTDVGKVKLADELKYWNSNEKIKLEKILDQHNAITTYYNRD